MIIKYDHLTGRPFVHGSVDCYTLVRDFFRDNLGLELTDYARPDAWWDKGLNLYMDNLQAEGFYVLDNIHPRDIQVCDVFYCAIQSKIANHAAIYVGEGNIVHHFFGRLSNVELYRGLWKNSTVAIIRHESMRNYKAEEVPFDLMDDPRIAWRLARAKAS